MPTALALEPRHWTICGGQDCPIGQQKAVGRSCQVCGTLCTEEDDLEICCLSRTAVKMDTIDGHEQPVSHVCVVCWPRFFQARWGQAWSHSCAGRACALWREAILAARDRKRADPADAQLLLVAKAAPPSAPPGLQTLAASRPPPGPPAGPPPVMNVREEAAVQTIVNAKVEELRVKMMEKEEALRDEFQGKEQALRDEFKVTTDAMQARMVALSLESAVLKQRLEKLEGRS